MFYNVIIAPIETIVEWVFMFINSKFSSYNIIVAVVGVSLVINFLALPLYNFADALQEKERKVSRALEPRVKRIKKAFKGDEQFMMLSEYYRQNDYHPLYVLRSSLSILIEIPFFIAAYHYLSNNSLLLGAKWWIFKNLGGPDELFSFAVAGKDIVINVLPILMTLINFVSGAIYCKDAPAREKIQLYGIALVFLALLYNSPSGLVIYWILNNLFSLVKNIVMKTKNPKKILHISISSVFVFISAYFLIKGGAFIKKLVLCLFTLVVVFLPYLKKLYERFLAKKNIVPKELTESEKKSNFVLFLLSSIGLSLFMGLLLSSSVVASSPAEFSFLESVDNPVQFVWMTFYKYIGLFTLWPLVIYFLFNDKVKKVLPSLMFIAFILAMLNVYVFDHDYGDLNVMVQIEDQAVLRILDFKQVMWYIVTPVAAAAVVVAVYYLLNRKGWLAYANMVLIAVIIGVTGLSAKNLVTIKDGFAEAKVAHELGLDKIEDKPLDSEIHFSKDGKNVLVFFLDRAINPFFPYACEQYPELREQFKGFTYYPNTVSYSIYTILGAPPLMGGYEYTPQNFNARKDELLKDTHTESTLVMPKLFADAGYQSTIIDPPWPNYSYLPDSSALDGYDGIETKFLRGVYKGRFLKECAGLLGVIQLDLACEKGMRDFVFLECLYPALRNTYYGNFTQRKVNFTTFSETYSVLYYLNRLTDASAEGDTFTFIDNETIHNPQFMNEDYSFPVAKKVKHNGQTYKVKDDFEQKEYDVFMTAILKVGEWLDYLKDIGVYDNTRIILVADHGYHIPLTAYANFADPVIPSSYSCLLMVKDFNATGDIKTDETFMTNADTVFFAKEGLDVSDKNPFTGKTFTQDKADGVNLWPVTAWYEVNGPTLTTAYEFTSLKESEAWHVTPGAVNNPDNWTPYLKWKKQQEQN